MSIQYSGTQDTKTVINHCIWKRLINSQLSGHNYVRHELFGLMNLFSP